MSELDVLVSLAWEHLHSSALHCRSRGPPHQVQLPRASFSKSKQHPKASHPLRQRSTTSRQARPDHQRPWSAWRTRALLKAPNSSASVPVQGLLPVASTVHASYLGVVWAHTLPPCVTPAHASATVFLSCALLLIAATASLFHHVVPYLNQPCRHSSSEVPIGTWFCVLHILHPISRRQLLRQCLFSVLT